MPANASSLEALFGRILSPFERFLRGASASGILLIAATIAALVLATWLGGDAVHHFWEREFALSSGGRFRLGLSLHHWVNDGLMALFFLVVGLELKREVMVGELSTLRDAMLPVAAAAGGMIVPALIYLAFNAGTPSAHGWGIAMATDIAFAVGILVLLGDRAPRGLIVFLTALAIADDLGAVLVIAFFYTAQIDFSALRASAALLVLLVLLNRGGVRHPLPYVLVGLMLWFYVLISGVHATIAGVLLAMTIPSRGSYTPEQFERRMGELHAALHADREDTSTPDDPLRNDKMASIAVAAEKAAVAVQSPLHRIEHGLAPWVAFAILPIFALVNAGIDLGAVKWGEALSSPVTLGIVGGLFIGKFAGISLFSWATVKSGFGRLPDGVSWRHVLGAGWLAGIGFTMSLFISELAFAEPELVDQARLGILLASCIAGAVGFAWLWFAGKAPKG